MSNIVSYLAEIHSHKTLLKRREFLIGVTALASGAALAACSDTNSPSASTTTPDRRYTLVLIQGVKGDPFYITMQKGAQARADELGVTLLVDGPAQFDATLQTPIVEKYISQKVDAMLIAACDKNSMIAPLKRASDAGIKVISVDTFIGDGDYASGPVTFPISYIGSDNVQGGKIAGEALIKTLGGSGKVYIQNVKRGVSTNEQREQGCRSAIAATNGAVSLVGVDYNNDSAATAKDQTSTLLQRIPDLSGIFGTNLFSAEGAAQAVRSVDRQGTIKIANFDAPEQAITDLRNGAVDLVIAQLPGEMGRIAVDYAVTALNGSTTGLQKRVATGYVVIDRDSVDTPEAQAAIYKNS